MNLGNVIERHLLGEFAKVRDAHRRTLRNTRSVYAIENIGMNEWVWVSGGSHANWRGKERGNIQLAATSDKSEGSELEKMTLTG